MTTIDHQQAAIDAAMPVMRRRDRCPNDSDCLACKAGVGQILAAATPHLRAAWEQELARAVKRLPWNGVTHGGTMVPLDAVLALLEGGDNQ